MLGLARPDDNIIRRKKKIDLGPLLRPGQLRATTMAGIGKVVSRMSKFGGIGYRLD